MPDLPSELFEDDDPFYSSVDQGMSFQVNTEIDFWEERVDGYDDESDDFVDPKPRRQSRRSVHDNTEDGHSGSRRIGRLQDEIDGSPRPRRKQRRTVRDQGFGEPALQRRLPRKLQDGRHLSSSRSADVSIDRENFNSPARRRQPRRSYDDQGGRPAPSRKDTVIEQPRMKAEAASADVVTSILPSSGRIEARPRPRKQRNPAWQWQPIIMPQPGQILVQALPSWLMAASVIMTLGLMRFMPTGLALWAPLVLLPTLLLLIRSDQARHPLWGRAAIVNLVVVGAFFPMMIVRQSFLRVPFVEFGNGTLVMPVVSTVMVILAMTVIAFGSAFLSQEDPEYAGLIFLPAAMLVPLFAGATEITGLSSALVILSVIYAVVGILMVIASMLPAAFPTLVAPIALALEFFVLPVSESAPIFPVGAGLSAKLLFFVVLAVGVGLTVAVPMMAVWVRQVRRIVQGSFAAASDKAGYLPTAA